MSDQRGPDGQRVALVTGASRGIGAAVATAFAATGAHVVLAARSSDELDRVAETIRSAGGSATAVTADITDEGAVQQLLAGIERRFGRLDAAVNNAGGSGRRPAPLHEWTTAEFEAAVRVNLVGTFIALKHELPLMVGSSGAIVNISSTAGLHGVAGLAGYVAAKHGVEGLTRVAALDSATKGVRINAIAPGPVLTDQLTAAGAAAQAATAATVPLGRLGTVEDIAEAAVWLCSPQSSFITGATLRIDGGILAGAQAGQPRNRRP